MGFIKDADIEKLMQNDELINDVAKGLVEDPDTMDSLVSDIADKLEDEMDNNPALRQKIIDAAVANDEFRKKVVAKLADELSSAIVARRVEERRPGRNTCSRRRADRIQNRRKTLYPISEYTGALARGPIHGERGIP